MVRYLKLSYWYCLVITSCRLQVVPRSIFDMLMWVSERYGFPEIIITENGVSDPREVKTVEDFLKDDFRINFLKGFIEISLFYSS